MRSIILFVMFTLFSSLWLVAQTQVQLVNQQNKKIIPLSKNDLAKISTSDSRGQVQYYEGRLSAVSDSAFTIAPLTSFWKKTAPGQVFFFKDVVGFRKFSPIRKPGEIAYSLVSVGLTGTISAVVGSIELPPAFSFLSAAATQTLTSGLKNMVLPTKIKHQMSDYKVRIIDKKFLN